MKFDWKLILGKYLKVLLSSFIAGILLSLGSIIYIACVAYIPYCGNLVGGLLSCVGMLLICLYGYNLYSFKIGYVLENNWMYLIEVVLTIVGNFVGALLMVFVVKGTYLVVDGSAFMNALDSIVSTRKNEGALSILLLSLLCGILLYFAFNTYKKAEQPIAKFLTLILIGSVVEILGLEHFVEGMFIYNLYSLFDGQLTINLTYMFIGNSVGCLLIPLLNKLRSKIKSA